MKVYSWNMLFRNEEQDRAFDFVKSTDWDVFCLQEVPVEFLERLKQLPFHIVYAVDKERLYPNQSVTDYLVILSKHPIQTQKAFSIPNYMNELQLRTRFFIRMMRAFHFTKLGQRNSLYADIAVPGFVTPVRVFCLHLILGTPAWRFKEFEIAMANASPTQPTIVCGDFNIIESLHTTVLNWWLGGSISDVLYNRRERTHIEKHFVSYALENPLRGKITHPFSRSQLDHILVSNSLSVAHAEVVSDSNGSDHHPIFVEVEK